MKTTEYLALVAKKTYTEILLSNCTDDVRDQLSQMIEQLNLEISQIDISKLEISPNLVQYSTQTNAVNGPEEHQAYFSHFGQNRKKLYLDSYNSIRTELEELKNVNVFEDISVNNEIDHVKPLISCRKFTMAATVSALSPATAWGRLDISRNAAKKFFSLI